MQTLATDSKICCYWLRPLLLGKWTLDQILFFSLGLMCKAPWVQNQRLVSGQMAGLEVGKGRHSSRGSIVVRKTIGVTTEEPRPE